MHRTSSLPRTPSPPRTKSADCALVPCVHLAGTGEQQTCRHARIPANIDLSLSLSLSLCLSLSLFSVIIPSCPKASDALSQEGGDETRVEGVVVVAAAVGGAEAVGKAAAYTTTGGPSHRASGRANFRAARPPPNRSKQADSPAALHYAWSA
jgi:hypothetical protein